MGSKINFLLQALAPGAVATQRWLSTKGVDARLADKYVRSGWLYRVGHGAFARSGTVVDWSGGLYALQRQLHLAVRPAGLSALELHGYAHNIVFGNREMMLFGPSNTKLPAWFRNATWSRPIRFVSTDLFSMEDEPESEVTVQALNIKLPVLERAALEMMYLVPKLQSYDEAFNVMQSLATLRPTVIQRYLEACRSVKAKRVFMHAADRLQHRWVNALDLSRVNFGSGRRSIHAGGRLDSKYNLVITDEDSY